MTERTTKQRPRIARFMGDQAGIAAVEFALIVPIMLLSYLGATDLTQALAIDRKLTQVASTVSDLVAQEETITRDKVQAFFQSGIAIMRPFEFESTKLRLTIVEVDGNSAEVTGATARNWVIDARNDDDYDLPDDMLELSEGRYVVVASASYDYAPMFSTVFNATMALEQRSIHIVRQEVEDFGFPLDDDDEERFAVAAADEIEQNCAGNSGEHVQGANCENNNNSHGG